MDTSDQLQNLTRMYDVCGAEMKKLKGLIGEYLDEYSFVYNSVQMQLLSKNQNGLQALEAYNAFCKDISDLLDPARATILQLCLQSVRRERETVRIHHDTRAIKYSRSALDTSNIEKVRDVSHYGNQHELADQKIVQSECLTRDSVSETVSTTADLVQRKESAQVGVISREREGTPSNWSDTTSPIVPTANQMEQPSKGWLSRDRENYMRNLENGDAGRQNEFASETRSYANRQENFNRESRQPVEKNSTPLPAKGNARALDLNSNTPEFNLKVNTFHRKTPESIPVRSLKWKTPVAHTRKSDSEDLDARFPKEADHPESSANANEWGGRQSNESNAMQQARTTAKDYGKGYASPRDTVKFQENSRESSPNRPRNRDVAPSRPRGNANDATYTKERTATHPQNWANASECVTERPKYSNESGSVAQTVEKELFTRRSDHPEFTKSFQTTEQRQTTNPLKAVMDHHPKDEERNSKQLLVSTLAAGWTRDTKPANSQICVRMEYPTEGSIIKIIPTYIASACSFYAQVENGSNYQLYWSDLETLGVSKLKTSPLLMEMVLSQFTDGNWYRAQVLECFDNRTFHVFYVDYGNEDIVSLDRLAGWNEKLGSFPFQAYKCRIARLRSSSMSSSEKEEAKTFLGNILLDNFMSVRVLHVTNELVIDITDSDLLTLPRDLINHKYAVRVESGI